MLPARLARHFVAAALSMMALAISDNEAGAATYPASKIALLVGFAPGGIADTPARMIGQGVTGRLHQTVVESRGRRQHGRRTGRARRS